MTNFTTSNYEYITKSQSQYIESNILEKASIIQDNLLNFKTIFENGEWARGELERIARELESVARSFIDQQGLNETYNLRNSTIAEVWGNRIDFSNKARNSRGQFYAGHIEYGHYGRDGKFVPAYPFMRPALFAVSKASQGDFANILAELAAGAFRADGTGYQGLNNIRFGKALGKAHSYSLPSNITLNRMKTPDGSHSKRFIDEILHDKFRNSLSVRRNRFDKRTSQRKEAEGWTSKKGPYSGRSYQKRRERNNYQYGKKSRPTVIQRKIREVRDKHKILTIGELMYQDKIDAKKSNALKKERRQKLLEEKGRRQSTPKKSYKGVSSTKGKKKGVRTNYMLKDDQKLLDSIRSYGKKNKRE